LWVGSALRVGLSATGQFIKMNKSGQVVRSAGRDAETLSRVATRGV